MKQEELKQLLEEKTELYERNTFIESDPISIPHQFTQKEDIEIAAFFAATIAWGQRPTIIRNANRLMSLMGNMPYEFVMTADRKQKQRLHTFVHRTFNGKDATQFVEALKAIYRDGGLEQAFQGKTTYDRIVHFHERFTQQFKDPRSNKHISNPEKKAAAKRINMFLRWMVRSDKRKVDFGIWKNIPTSELIMPLDVHTGNVGRSLGLLQRTQNDWQSAEELTMALRKFDRKDPVKYDFALFGLGAFEGWK
jgi:uncharacterized protein (TIGR02757 family)